VRSDLPVRWVLPDLRVLKAHKDLLGRKAAQASGVKSGPLAHRDPLALKVPKGRLADRGRRGLQVKEVRQDLRVPPVLSVRLVQLDPPVHLDRKVHPAPQDRPDSPLRTRPQ
jgi:hypothetical protein